MTSVAAVSFASTQRVKNEEEKHAEKCETLLIQCLLKLAEILRRVEVQLVECAAKHAGPFPLPLLITPWQN